MTKTEQALEFMAQGLTRYAAAKKAGMQPHVLYTELKKRNAKEEGICWCCGQKLPESSPRLSQSGK